MLLTDEVRNMLGAHSVGEGLHGCIGRDYIQPNRKMFFLQLGAGTSLCCSYTAFDRRLRFLRRSPSRSASAAFSLSSKSSRKRTSSASISLTVFSLSQSSNKFSQFRTA